MEKMTTTILDEARLFLMNSLKGKTNGSESIHPWRRGWEFVVLHSLRVEAYVMKILARERHSLSEHEVTLVRLAAILHDVGRLDKRDGHAQLGAEIAGSWLRENHRFPLENIDIVRVMVLIAGHSNKDIHEPDFGMAVLKDADTLDEIGAMSIFMSGNRVDGQSPYFFYDLRQRLIDFEIPYCDKKFMILHTHGAREILMEKKAFVENFIVQITDELQAEENMVQMMIKISKRSIGEASNDG